GIGQGVSGVLRDRRLEVLDPLRDVRLRAAVPREAALEVQVVGAEIGAVPDRGRVAEILQESRAERVDDGARDLVLDRENVGQLAVVALRPERPPVPYAGVLGRDAEPGAGAAHRAIEHGADVEPSAERAYVLAPPLEG